MDNDTLKDAVIEAARHLVHKHVESEIVTNRHTGLSALRLAINTGDTTHVRFLGEGDAPLPDNLYGALADLLGAVDAYEEAVAETEGMNNE